MPPKGTLILRHVNVLAYALNEDHVYKVHCTEYDIPWCDHIIRCTRCKNTI
jgi:hypothetical protein